MWMWSQCQLPQLRGNRLDIRTASTTSFSAYTGVRAGEALRVVQDPVHTAGTAGRMRVGTSSGCRLSASLTGLPITHSTRSRAGQLNCDYRALDFDFVDDKIPSQESPGIPRLYASVKLNPGG